MLRDNLGDGVGLGLALQFAADPGAFGPGEDLVNGWLALRQRAVVQVGRVVQVAGSAGGIHLDVQHPLGDDAPLAGSREAGVLDGVLQVEEHARGGAWVALVDQHRAAAQQVAVALQGEVDGGIEQRVAGADEGGERLALGATSDFSKAMRS